MNMPKAVIASQRVDAKHRPTTSSAKQSIEPEQSWIASSLRFSQ
jgi:hypothetical protein